MAAIRKYCTVVIFLERRPPAASVAAVWCCCFQSIDPSFFAVIDPFGDSDARMWSIHSHLNRRPHSPPVATPGYDSDHDERWDDNPTSKRSSVAPKQEHVILQSLDVADSNDIPHVKHVVLPSDTFEGLCLRYEVTPTQLRRANGILCGKSLSLAPPVLKIPIADAVAPQDTNSQAFKLQALRLKFPTLEEAQAQA